MILQPDEYHSRQLKYAHLEKVGGSALQQCGVFDSTLSFISDTGNVVFRGDTVSQSYCVRVYPEPFRSIPEICGELYWLLDLRQNTDMIIPEPLKNMSGAVVQEIAAPDGGNKFQVVIFHWIPGDIIGSNLDIKTAKQLGVLMAKLHTHADNFVLPKDSFRENTDWQGMGHLRAGLTPTQISRIESFLEKDQLVLCDEAAKRAATTINEIDIQSNFGLIHSDLHANNCLKNKSEIGIIDFDDCHFAPFSGDIAITISSFDDFPNRELFHSAFLEGYSENRELPQNYVKEIESLAIERRLRLIRWVSTWPNVDYFPFGRQVINNSLLHCRKYIES
jgi:Ser/Thr protein kinase RdoA (MazF antagonist)